MLYGNPIGDYGTEIHAAVGGWGTGQGGNGRAGRVGGGQEVTRTYYRLGILGG